jgi:hypothetical protein
MILMNFLSHLPNSHHSSVEIGTVWESLSSNSIEDYITEIMVNCPFN